MNHGRQTPHNCEDSCNGLVNRMKQRILRELRKEFGPGTPRIRPSAEQPRHCRRAVQGMTELRFVVGLAVSRWSCRSWDWVGGCGIFWERTVVQFAGQSVAGRTFFCSTLA